MKSLFLSSAARLLAAPAIVGLALATPDTAVAQTVSDRALSDLKVDSLGGCTTLTVNFNIRVQLISFFPETTGRELHIRVLPLDGTKIAQTRDSLRTPETVPMLRSVQYEADNAAGPVLSLFFTHNMDFAVEAGRAPQQLVIRLSEPRSRSCLAAPASASMATAAAVPSSEAPPLRPAAPAPAGLYVINVISSPRAIGDLVEAQNRALAGLTLYESEFEKDSQRWHRLRAGFFETREAAEVARKRMLAFFPDAWVLKIQPEERAQGLAASVDQATAGAAVAAPTSVATANDGTTAGRMLADAEQALRDGNLDRAAQLLTDAVALPDNPSSARARELLGLVRERKGHKIQAKAEYEEYLRRYPTGDGADRVRQRLANLMPATTTAPAPQLRAASGNGGTSKAWSWGARGSFSQFYFRDQGRTTNFNPNPTLGTEVDRSVNVNQLLTAGDITITGGNDRRQLQIRAAGSYTKNFGTSASISTIDNGGQTLTFRSRPGGGIEALTALYLDYSDADLNSSLRIGRQTRNSAGVLGRFDGALYGFQANPTLRVNMVGGFPVLSSHQMSVLKERPFYGLSVDLGNKRSALQTTVYAFEQRARGGFLDRRALGIEARYLKKSFNAYAILDYDVKFNRVNLGLFTLNYNFPDTSSISISADYRQSPLLTTTNALIGQIDTTTNMAIQTLSGLRPFFTDAQIYGLAKDRTLTAKSMTVTYARPITKKLQISADFNLTDTGGTPATPATAGTMEVGALPASGKEFYYGLQLIGSGLLWSNDIYIMSGRYSNTANARIYTADFNARIPVTGKFRVAPRMRYGFRDDKPSTNNPVPGTYTQLQPTMRINYYPVNHSEIEIEFGGNFTSQSVFDSMSSAWGRIKERGWVLSSGYRLDF